MSVHNICKYFSGVSGRFAGALNLSGTLNQLSPPNSAGNWGYHCVCKL